MSARSLRRSRALDSDDDDDNDDDGLARQNTPISTARHDGKRARRSLTLENDDDDGGGGSMPASPPKRQTSRAQNNRDPILSRTSHQQNKPRHQPGAIVRIQLTNFVTYTSAEFFPGPNLNMVIGPNGTGKSTLVCAICLGLGWSTQVRYTRAHVPHLSGKLTLFQYLGRAKDAADFVKHGCREATIEIELQRATRGPNSSKANPVITRTIKREGNKSTYTLNGQPASGKAVMELARSFNIQIDNLCQFLPQDKVVEFAQMTPIEILQNTQRAAAPPEMLQLHGHLKDLRRAQKESNDHKKNDREALANLENRQDMQRTEVERLRDRAVVQKRLGWLQRCRPIPQYAESKQRYKEARERLKIVSAEHRQLKEESGPALKRVEAKRLYVKEVQEHTKESSQHVKKAERECDRLAAAVEEHNTTIKDCEAISAAERRSQQPTREDINRIRVRIATLKKQKEQPPEPFDSRTLNQDIQSRVNRVREIDTRIDEARAQAVDLKQQAKARVVRGKQIQEHLDALNTVVGRQEELLKSKSNDTYRAWDWIKNNREMFKKPVFGPPMVECTLKDPTFASSIESVLQQNDYRIFTVQCEEDFKLLQRELNGTQRLHDISLRTCPLDSLDSFQSPLSTDEMRQLGLQGWAIDYLEGPPTVLAMLCTEKFLHQCALAETDVTQAQHDQLANMAVVKSYVTKTKSFQFIRRAEYGAAGVIARERALRRPEVWTNQPIETGRQQQTEVELRELKGEVAEIKSQLAQMATEHKELDTEKSQLNEEIDRLREDKEEKQKAWVVYNGLDTKIKQAEEKIAELQENLNGMRRRLEDNQRRQDEAMFAKAEVVLEYGTAVHALQEKIRGSIALEVALIEARNDFEVLSERNRAIVELIDQKGEEVRQEGETASRENQRARELVNAVKGLRSEALELAEQEDDRGLIELLEDMSAKSDLKESDLDSLISVEEAKLELTEGGDANTIKEFEERGKRIEQLRSRLTQVSAKQQELLLGIREVRDKWEGPLDELVQQISDAFGDSFARIGCAGQVTVYKASSDDPADCSEELGGRDNGLDFANWAIHIRVKFRDHEPLSLLDSHRQSGGERAVSTIFYLMALQSLSRAPFRVVDEINQGMDPRNERMVHGRMVDMAAAADDGDDGDRSNGQRHGSQYFLITPKLLSGLRYRAGMTVLCIVSGENMPSAVPMSTRDEHGNRTTTPGKKMDFALFAQQARRLGFSRGKGPGPSQGTRNESGWGTANLDSVNRWQAVVRHDRTSVGA